MNMIQDMIDFGFVIDGDASDVEKFIYDLDKGKRVKVSIYSRTSFGLLSGLYDASEASDGTHVLYFKDTIYAREYGRDYRILNKEEMEHLSRLIEILIL